jgi:hypothetical protein
MSSKIKVIIIIGASMLVCGLAMAAVGYVNGGMKDVILMSDGPVVAGSEEGQRVDEVDETFDDVTSIDISLGSVSNVTLKEGPEVTVKGRSPVILGGLKADISNEGTLTIGHSAWNKSAPWVISFAGLFDGRRFSGWDSSYVEITAPDLAALSAITVDIGYGDVKLDGLSAGRIDINSTGGEVITRKLDCDTLIISASYGETEATDIDAREVRISNASGEMNLQNIKAPRGLTLKSSYGSIDIDDIIAGKSVFTLSSGDFSADDVDFADGVTIRNSYGSIGLTGSLRGMSEIDSSSGDINLMLDGNEDEYSISTNVASGDISIGDKRLDYRGGGRIESGPSTARNSIIIDNAYGDVTIDFR